MITYGSLFSGMEAASLAFKPMGWKCAFVAEIDKAPSALLSVRYPNVPNHGDVTKFADWPDYAIDLLIGGSPCQSFSVAGLRKGLDDPRGSLMLTYGAVAKRYRPAWLLWENVPGVLSSNGGRDFGSFLGMLAELGYGFAYRVLDAQFFGLAQRRKRVFVVGHLGDWRPPAAVLFEPESLRGDSAPSRKAREGIAGTIDASAGRSRGAGINPTALAPAVSYALNAHGGAQGRIDAESETFIAHALRAEGFDASEDGTGRGTPLVVEPYTLAIRGRGDSHDLEYRQDGLANALLTPNGGRAGIGVGAIAFSSKDHGADAGELAPTLRAMGHAESHANAGGQVAIAFDTTQITSAANRSNPQAGDPCHPVTSLGHAPAVAFNITPSNSNRDYNARQSERAQAVTTQGGAPSARGGDVIVHGTQDPCVSDVAFALGRNNGGENALLGEWAVRRLTPKECERLQGAPDDHTLITYRGKPIADGPRYKMIGNSFAVNCVRWIGQRIEIVDSTLPHHDEKEQTE